MYNYVFFTTDGTMLDAAKKLKEAGENVVVAFVQDKMELMNEEETKKETQSRKEETPEDTAKRQEKDRRRLSVFDGILKKYPASLVLKGLKKVNNKQDYRFIFDSNNLWKYGEEVVALGFEQGNFPMEEDRKFEDDRMMAKEFIAKNYPDIKQQQVQEFKNTEEAIKFLEEEQEGMWVLKSQGDKQNAVVPKTNDPELSNKVLINALQEHADDYNSSGILLEQRILKLIEVTPQIIFKDGRVVYPSIDIETKTIGAGENNGPQAGCATNLNFPSSLGDKINQISFPPIVFEMAAKRKGIFIWDISLLIDEETGDIYPGEFCPNRFGYDSLFCEFAMSADDQDPTGVKNYFEKLFNGQSPLIKTYGTSVRLFNIGEDDSHNVKEGNLVLIKPEAENNVFWYEVQTDKQGKINTTGGDKSFAVVTAGSNDLFESINEMYDMRQMVVVEDMLERPKIDFESSAYQTSILHRLQYLRDNGFIDSIKGGATPTEMDKDELIKILNDRLQ